MMYMEVKGEVRWVSSPSKLLNSEAWEQSHSWKHWVVLLIYPLSSAEDGSVEGMVMDNQ